MKRIPLPDLLKGFAVFLIIPVHILETFIDYPGRESLFGKILLVLGGPVAVPIIKNKFLRLILFKGEL